MKADEARNPLLVLKTAYERARPWATYLALGLVLLILYFGSLLGPFGRALLPAAVVTAVMFIISTLQNIEQQVTITSEAQSFQDEAGAAATLAEFVANDRNVTDIKVIAATGGTTLSSIIPLVCRKTPAHVIEMSMLLIDPNSPISELYPPHWIDEARICTQRAVTDYGSDPRCQLRISQYDYLPVLHGVMINNRYLLLGFFAWSQEYGVSQLSGSDRPHRLYDRRDKNAEDIFWVFEEWFYRSPQKVVYPAEPAHPARHDGSAARVGRQIAAQPNAWPA